MSLTSLWRHITRIRSTTCRPTTGPARASTPDCPYRPDQSVATPLGYPYPPLLAILFRPLALLPFEAAPAIREVAVLACFAGTILWLGPRRRETWLALGILAPPIVWCLVIGQAQVVLYLFTAIGAPWSIALAANIKLFPAAISLWWIGRREWRRFGEFLVSIAVLVLIQLILAPKASLDYLTAISLHQVGGVVNLSPYVVTQLLWARPRGRGRRRCPVAGPNSPWLGRRGDAERRGEPSSDRLHAHGAARPRRRPHRPPRPGADGT